MHTQLDGEGWNYLLLGRGITRCCVLMEARTVGAMV